MTAGDTRIELLYGKSSVRVTLPEGCVPTIIQKRSMPVLPVAPSAVFRALAEPVSSPPLRVLAREAATACILICDITRPVPNHLFLRPLVETLIASGMAAGAITILVATGLHRPNDDSELAEIVGDPWVLATVRVVNHYATRPEDHVAVGVTSRGTEVSLDKRFVDADLRIATGLVEPHFMAGYSGGRKVIAPGVAGAATIRTLHGAALMADPRAATCILDGNPLHAEQLEVVEMIGGALALNVVIDEARNVAFVNFGEVVESHLRAVAFAREYTEVPVPRRFRTVVTSAAGYPLDKTYYQTVKGMVGALDILEPGGDLIVVSACSEGLGSPAYRDAQRRLVTLGPDGFWESIRSKPQADIDEWQTQMQLKPLRAGRVHLYTDGLSVDERALTGVEMIDSVEAAVATSIARHADPRVAFVPEGPYVVPVHTAAP